MRETLVSLAVVAVAVVATWAIFRAFGLELALGTTLLLSVGLTLALNLALRAASGRPRLR